MGDVIPFLEIAGALRDRGHETVLLANSQFRELIVSRGVEFHAVGGKQEYLDLAQNEDLYHPLRGPKRIADQWILPSVRKTLDYLTIHPPGPDTVLVGSFSTVGLRMAKELYNLPMHTLVLSPFMLPSAHLPPVSPRMSVPAWTPRPFKTLYNSLADGALDHVLKPGINALRASCGLPLISSTVRRWWFSPDSVIGLFPEWFAPAQPDWPSTLSLTNFVISRGPPQPFPSDLETFLAEEGRLAVITMGSVLTIDHGFLETMVDACLISGFKVLVLMSKPQVLECRRPRCFQEPAFTPLLPVLRRASLIIHHGGIGTASIAILAGTPQLVAPQGHDQFDNAARLVRLGVAKFIRTGRSLTVQRSLAQINALLQTPEVALSCRRTQALYYSSPGLDDVCRLLETTGRAAFAVPHGSLRDTGTS
jgi:rhamnosyltransferase subunit B